MINIPLIHKDKKNLIKINISELARRIGRSRTWVSLVLNGRVRVVSTRKAIAAALVAKYNELSEEKNNE